MKEKVHISPEFASIPPFDRPGGVDWWSLTGEVVARSRSSETQAIRLSDSGVELHLKRYRYSFRQAVRGCLRNTFLFGRSRVEREFRTLQKIGSAAGEGFVPRPIAFGERRRAGFLTEAFLATETVPHAVPLSDVEDHAAGTSRRLGAFLGTLHGKGITHGRLYGRNLLRVAGGGFRIVDLDRARIGSRAVTSEAAAEDLACLFVSVPSFTARQRMRILGSWLGPDRTREKMSHLLELVEERWDPAQRGLKRRDGPPHV